MIPHLTIIYPLFHPFNIDLNKNNEIRMCLFTTEVLKMNFHVPEF